MLAIIFSKVKLNTSNLRIKARILLFYITQLFGRFLHNVDNSLNDFDFNTNNVPPEDLRCISDTVTPSCHDLFNVFRGLLSSGLQEYFSQSSIYRIFVFIYTDTVCPFLGMCFRRDTPPALPLVVHFHNQSNFSGLFVTFWHSEP